MGRRKILGFECQINILLGREIAITIFQEEFRQLVLKCPNMALHDPQLPVGLPAAYHDANVAAGAKFCQAA